MKECTKCGEPTCEDCSEGLDDVHYGYCVDCFNPDEKETERA